MSLDPQLVVVLLVVAAAAVYAGRSFLRQFRVGDDDTEGCSTCGSNEYAHGDDTEPAATRPRLVTLSKPDA